MNSLDLFLAGGLTVSVVIGCMRGLVYEAMMLLGWVIAFYVAQWWSPALADMLPVDWEEQTLRRGVAFLILFVGALFTNGLLAWVLKYLFSGIGLRPLDRALGGLFGILRALVLMLGLTLGVHALSLTQADWWRQSLLAPWLDQGLIAMKPLLPDMLAGSI